MTKPNLYILCGLPGSGKSTFANKLIAEYKENTCLFSSDEIRAELWGSEECQKNPEKVFSLMQDRTIEALKKGYNVIYDATSLTRKSRKNIISRSKKIANLICYIIWSPIEMCVAQDASRKRTVGKAVIDKMAKTFQAPYYDEGFAEINAIIPQGFNSVNYYIQNLKQSNISHDNPHHSLSIQEHCYAAYEVLKDKNPEIAAAALVHDCGKPYTKAFIDSKGNPCDTAHYYQHQNIGAWMSYGFDLGIEVPWLVSTHMDPFFNTKYYRNLSEDLKLKIDLLHSADVSAH